MVASFAKLFSERTTAQNVFLGLICIVLLSVQLFFLVRPTDVVWYTPTILFYLKVGAGLIGFGSFIVLSIYNRRYFLPRHYMGVASIMFAAIGYACIGFGTEYVALMSKPQIYIERAEVIFWMLGSIYVASSATCPPLKLLNKYCLLCVIPALALAPVVYTVLAPIDWPHLPAFSSGTMFGIYLVTALGWTVAGLRYMQVGKAENAILDYLVGVCLMIAAAMAGMHFFPIWHPLWTIWQYITIAAFSLPAIVLIIVSVKRRKFEVKPFFMYTMFLLLVPLIALVSGLAGIGTFMFGAKTLTSQEFTDATRLQQIYRNNETIENPALTVSHTRANLVCFESQTDFASNGNLLPFSLSATDVSRASYNHPLAIVTKTTQPGVPPSYHLVEVIVLDKDAGLDGPIAITSQAQPDLFMEIARVRLITMGAMVALCLVIFAALWQVILIVDRRIVRQQQNLKQAFSDLKIAEQSREELTHMVVHDLRSPLSAIQTSLQVLERTTTELISDRQHRTLNRALSATESMGTMISDILNISKMENGRLELSYSHIHLQDLLSDRKYSYEAVALKEQKMLVREQDLPDGQEWLSADGDLLRRVFDNLISNALRYTPRGGQVSISAKALGENVVFKVKDTGVGIPSEELPFIFDKFSQASEDPMQRRKGIGLGLAFCKLAVEAHGGEIWVESEIGKGTTFTFTIPYRAPQSAQEPELIVTPIEKLKRQTSRLTPINFGLPSLGQRDTGSLSS